MSQHRDPAELLARVARWIEDDPDPATREELEALLGARDTKALFERFDGELVFGTAGIRGEIGAGPLRMNRAVVARATAGVCKALADHVKDARERGIVVGYDGRHMSRELAEETCAVAAGFGIRVRLFEQVVPTPVLAYAVTAERAAGGVMVTASHNPARDNGYKVYWENGAQIIPPADQHIARAMTEVGSLRALPRMARDERRARGLEVSLGAALEARYLAAVHALVGPGGAQAEKVQLAYTALHGVGERFVRAALAQAGFAKLATVAEQAEPDPDFPTVAFPNPEEAGAMDRVQALADAVEADLALANDPDADRLCVAVRGESGALQLLSGNQIGVLLAEYLLARDKEPEQCAVLSSIVSTPMIAGVAAAHGSIWEPTLTGFKWIANRAMELERGGVQRCVLGFEEALGYSAGSLVRDKDGVSTAVLVARVCADAKAQGRTLLDLLADLYREHGVYLSGQVSLRMGPDGQRAMMSRARSAPPAVLAGRKRLATIDLLNGAVDGTPSFRPKLPASDVLIWELEGGQRVIVRPSGTEPKLKLYIDVREPVAAGEPLADASVRGTALLAEMTEAVRAYATAGG